jgi:hypothetical protein
LLSRAFQNLQAARFRRKAPDKALLFQCLEVIQHGACRDLEIASDFPDGRWETIQSPKGLNKGENLILPESEPVCESPSHNQPKYTLHMLGLQIYSNSINFIHPNTDEDSFEE